MAATTRNLNHFAVFVALLTGTPRRRAMADLDIDGDLAWQAELLLRGDDRGRRPFDPHRVSRALKYADDVGMRGSL
jgi:hypothetical protein